MTETTTPLQPVLRLDYSPPAFTIDTVDLAFDLDPNATRVTARMDLRRAHEGHEPLVLSGEKLELLSVRVDGELLPPDRYHEEADELTIQGLPAKCVLETEVRIDPENNTSLSGLYLSSGNFCTQCEAEGFRRITYFLDRPDVLARYTTTITADKKRFPVLLSNGNRIESEELEDGRHRVRWEDPWPKPCYLFALVAGDLACHAGSFTTCSGREVRLEIWVEPQESEKCEHALRSLQRAMRWDEEVFGLEYDLDLYMIVAVGDFNAGAMENKGLNIFNSKYVLAQPETATDDDYESIEGVIAHEYFHNWTGNRVTCRDWFQLTLKEGLTVFRDQQFSADMISHAVRRIVNVRNLRNRQLPEDAGPMSHPIRPESYIRMDNFYTATVYEKGAEVIRMVHTLLGADGFRAGMDLYFERHDGGAVTCDDFRAAMADANGRDLTQFERWYSQAGTPILQAKGVWDAEGGRYSLTLTQKAPEGRTDFEPTLMPVRIGLIGPQGQDQPLVLEGQDAAADAPTERVLELTQSQTTFVFTGLDAEPVPSILRGYSAPVILELERTTKQLAFLLRHDSDPFTRWDAGQTLFGSAVLGLAADRSAGRPLALDPSLVEAFRAVLQDSSIDGSMRALTLTLPAERELAQRMQPVEPDALHEAREFLRRELARTLRSELTRVYTTLAPRGPYSNDKAEIDRRRTRNCALGYLTSLDEPETTALAWAQFQSADNMTDSQAALACLARLDVPERALALEQFHATWTQDPLVIDKWFMIQAASTLSGAAARVQALASHPDFQATNPNRLRSLVTAFATENHAGFHDPSGEGYVFVADHVLSVDTKNPAIAARLSGAFLQWRRLEPGRRELMKAQLERIARADQLSKNTAEIVGRALGD